MRQQKPVFPGLLQTEAAYMCMPAREDLGADQAPAGHAQLRLQRHRGSAEHAALRCAGAMVPEYEHVRALIKYLQAMRGRPLWRYEDASLQVSMHSVLQQHLDCSACTCWACQHAQKPGIADLHRSLSDAAAALLTQHSL